MRPCRAAGAHRTSLTDGILEGMRQGCGPVGSCIGRSTQPIRVTSAQELRLTGDNLSQMRGACQAPPTVSGSRGQETTMWFRCRCRAAALLHSISCRLRGGQKIAPRRPPHEDYDLSRYLETAEKLNLEIIPLGCGMYELKRGNITRRFLRNISVEKENPVSCRLCCNKHLTYQVLERNGIRCLPRHQLYTFNDVGKTCEDFRKWNCPVVIKPCSGTHGGMGVTVNIRSLRELKNAIAESFIFDRKAYLMEQFIEGSHFRLLTLHGEFLGCFQRRPARIVGNGRDSIETLIHQENERRSRDRSPDALYPIRIANEVRRKLRSMHMSLSTVLKANEQVYLRDNINFSVGGEIDRVDDVSEDIKRTCRDIAAILNIYFAGFDIITRDITKSLGETNGVINEVNTSPGTNRQYLLTQAGEPVHITELVLRDMFDMPPVVLRGSAGCRV